MNQHDFITLVVISRTMTGSRNLAENGVGTNTGVQNRVLGRSDLGTADGLVRYLTWLASFARHDEVEKIPIGHDVFALESMVVRRTIVLIVYDVFASV